MATHPFKVHDRVRHVGQQWPEATKGTATILEVRPHVFGTFEYLVHQDKPWLGPTSGNGAWWNSEQTVLCEERQAPT